MATPTTDDKKARDAYFKGQTRSLSFREELGTLKLATSRSQKYGAVKNEGASLYNDLEKILARYARLEKTFIN